MPFTLTAEEQQRREWLSYFYSRHVNSSQTYREDRLRQFGWAASEIVCMEKNREHFATPFEDVGQAWYPANRETRHIRIRHLAYVYDPTNGQTVGERMVKFMREALPNTAEGEECTQFLLDMGVDGFKERAPVVELLRGMRFPTKGEERSAGSEVMENDHPAEETESTKVSPVHRRLVVSA